MRVETITCIFFYTIHKRETYHRPDDPNPHTRIREELEFHYVHAVWVFLRSCAFSNCIRTIRVLYLGEDMRNILISCHLGFCWIHQFWNFLCLYLLFCYCKLLIWSLLICCCKPHVSLHQQDRSPELSPNSQSSFSSRCKNTKYRSMGLAFRKM